MVAIHSKSKSTDPPPQHPSLAPPHLPALLQLLGKLTGKSSAIERLLGSLTVSNQKIVTTLNWQPPYTVEQGLEATAKWYLNQKKRTTD